MGAAFCDFCTLCSLQGYPLGYAHPITLDTVTKMYWLWNPLEAHTSVMLCIPFTHLPSASSYSSCLLILSGSNLVVFCVYRRSLDSLLVLLFCLFTSYMYK
ncbi:hypothetical protein AMTR_s00119p00034140, partial [Amborella trichopoda]